MPIRTSERPIPKHTVGGLALSNRVFYWVVVSRDRPPKLHENLLRTLVDAYSESKLKDFSGDRDHVFLLTWLYLSYRNSEAITGYNILHEKETPVLGGKERVCQGFGCS